MISRTFVAGLVAAAVTVACSGDKTKPKTPPVPVAVTRAVRRDVPYNLTANGTVEPMQTAQVQAQVAGILTRVTFKEGDEVQAGQVLFQIDPAPYKAALDQATANLGRDLATFADAKAEAERYKKLVQQGYVTQEAADQTVATAGSTQGAVKGDSAAIDQAHINLDWTTIRAPIGGRVGQLLVKQGNLIRSGAQQPLVLINQIKPILVHFALPATSLPAVQEYASKGALPVTVVPGMPPSATAQPVSNGPTPAYTTEPTDDQQGQPVSVGAAADDPAPGAPGGAAGGAPAGGGQAPNGRHKGQGGGGVPAGAATPAGGTGAPSTPGAADGPPNASGGGSGRRGARSADTGAMASASRPPRSMASMPTLPGVRPPAPSKGTLTLIDNQVDTTTGTVLYKATFENADKTLWPGQFVATTIRLFVEQNALVVPAQAVMMGQQGTYVYLVDAAGTAQQRPVGVERTSANVAVITSGLNEGDQVVTDGQSRLTPNAKVNIRALTPGGAGGAPAVAQSSSG